MSLVASGFVRERTKSWRRNRNYEENITSLAPPNSLRGLTATQTISLATQEI